MITLMIGLVVVVAVIAVICLLVELVEFALDLGLRGCFIVIIVIAVFGLLAYGVGSLVQIVVPLK